MAVVLVLSVSCKNGNKTDHNDYNETTQELIRISTKSGEIRLTGRRLGIEYYTNAEMKITGLVSAIEYRQQKEG